MFYVVGVLHSTGHGIEGMVAQVTDDPIAALKTAFRIENLNYEFFENGTGAVVYRLASGRCYPKGAFMLPVEGPVPPDHPVVFARTHYRGAWRDVWFDENLRQQLTAV